MTAYYSGVPTANCQLRNLELFRVKAEILAGNLSQCSLYPPAYSIELAILSRLDIAERFGILRLFGIDIVVLYLYSIPRRKPKSEWNHGKVELIVRGKLVLKVVACLHLFRRVRLAVPDILDIYCILQEERKT
jgi:hypothetical protein